MFAFHIPDNQEIWIGTNGFDLEDENGAVLGHLFVTGTSGPPSWNKPGGGVMPGGQAWWSWNVGVTPWPAKFSVVPRSTKLTEVPSTGTLVKFESKAFSSELFEPNLEGDIWVLRIATTDIGYLRKSGGTFGWYAHSSVNLTGGRLKFASGQLKFVEQTDSKSLAADHRRIVSTPL